MIRLIVFSITVCLLAGRAFAGDIVMYAFGDTGDCDVVGTARVAAALKARPDSANALILELGDLAYPTATSERLQECHEPYFAQFKSRLAVPGNHDWRDPQAKGFFSLFPQAVPRYVDLGGLWRIFLLDSNLRDEAWSKQLRWVDQATRDSGGKCVIAAWHHPRWSSGARGDNDLTDSLWQKIAGVASFTLHAHDHHFETLAPINAAGNLVARGTASFIVGTGGASLYPVTEVRRGTRAIAGQWGFLRVQFGEQSYQWQMVNTEGKVLDQGRGVCLPVAGELALK